MSSPVIKLSAPETRQFWEIPVLYEDEHLLALNKPPLLLTSPDRADASRPSLVRLLHDAIKAAKPWARERGMSYLMNAHRLDPETSGVILLARSRPMLVALADLFGAEKPVRTYVTVVRGNPAETAWEVDAPIAPHPSRPGLMCVNRNHGKRARTRFEVLEAFSDYTLLKCLPLTHRPHQIRVHLKHCRLPACGDMAYGCKPLWLSRLKPDYRLKPGHEERPLIGTVALHAERLQLSHPVTGAPLDLMAERPKDLTVALKYLRRYASGGQPGASAPDELT